jgi:tRNA(fMet)-specific endonuclease VapC
VNLTFMVETDWAVHWLRGNEQILERLSKLRKRGLGLSIISLAELYAGVHRSTDISEAREALEDFLSLVTILGVKEEICQIFGEENARLRKAGQIIEDFDLLIAATCLHHNLKLLTNNRRHFQRIEGLEIISTDL